MPNYKQLKGCCNAYVIFNFGGADSPNGDVSDEKESKAEIMDEVHQIMEHLKYQGASMAVATTDHQQDSANIALEEMGWVCIGPIKKKKCPDTFLFFWYIILGEEISMDYMSYLIEQQEKEDEEDEEF